MSRKLTTDVLGLTKYSEVDMPDELNVISVDMQKIDDYAGEVDEWREQTDDTLVGLRHDIDELQPQTITALENKVNTNAINIANQATDISVLRQRANSADNRLDAIEAEQLVQNADIADIKAEQIVQNSAISALGDDITDLSNSVTNYETTTDNRLDAIESDIADLKTEDETITAQLSLDATELADHEERIGALEGGGTSTIPQRVTDLETEVGVLDTAVQGLGTDMDNAESAIGTLQSDVSTLSNTVSSQETRLTSAESNITTLNNKMGLIQCDMIDLSGFVNSDYLIDKAFMFTFGSDKGVIILDGIEPQSNTPNAHMIDMSHVITTFTAVTMTDCVHTASTVGTTNARVEADEGSSDLDFYFTGNVNGEKYYATLFVNFGNLV